MTSLTLVCLITPALLRGQETADGNLYDWTQMPLLPDELGVAGPFVGIHNDALIVAGGANFTDGVPWHPTPNGGQSFKKYHDTIYLLPRLEDGTYGDWITVQRRLPETRAYGVSLSTSQGLLCIGGESAQQAIDQETGETSSIKHLTADAFVLSYRRESDDLVVHQEWPVRIGELTTGLTIPDLPVAVTNACGAVVGDYAYVAGGDSGEGGSHHFWRLSLQPNATDEWRWEQLPAWDGPPRQLAIGIEQAGSFFLFSGRSVLESEGYRLHTDAWRFDPAAYERELRRATPNSNGVTVLPSYANGWTRLADIAPEGSEPLCVMAGTGAKAGFDYVMIYGGARGDILWKHEVEYPAQIAAAESDGNEELAEWLTEQIHALYDNHPGFSSEILAYHITTDTWTKRGEMPVTGPVTTPAVRWGNDVVIASGERIPGVRTRDVWLATPHLGSHSFGAINWIVLAAYLATLVGIGFYFSRREASSEDFFLASGRVPWWAAGLSIFATMLSAITYLSIPARTYGTNWTWLILNMGIPLIAIIVAYLYLPFFRRVRAASAYDYLEQRFHVSLRIFGSLAFMLFQLGRMGIVVLLPALALAAVTGINVYVCIIVMGVLSTLYTVLGGIEAVIWTDVVQTLVLIGGAVAALAIIVLNIDGGLFGVIEMASGEGKFVVVNEFHFHDLDWAKDGILVILLGAIFSNLLPYTSDQAVLQRYLTVPSECDARRAILTNGFLAVPASLLFLFVGSALWTFYRSHATSMVPLEKPDQVFPWFIAQEMPAGLAGLVIAGVFAAAMSSLDSSMHSIATAGTTDFYERFGRPKTSQESLRVARMLTVLLGVVGTGSALLLANMEIQYLWDLFLKIVGLFLGTLGGLFTLGIFSSRAGTLHAWMGAIASTSLLGWCQYATNMHGLLNGGVAVGACVTVGIISSWIIPIGNSRGLSIHDSRS